MLNTKKIILILCFLCSGLIAEDGGYGIKVFMQSSKTNQYYPGEIFSVSFNVFNMGDKQDQFNPRLDAPENWKTIPPLLFPFQLAPSQNTVQIFAIKIPSNYPAGTYNLKYYVQGTTHPTMLGSSSFTVEVLPLRDIQTKILQSPKKILEGESYELEVAVSNYGNVYTNVELSLKEYQNFSYSIEPKGVISLEPGETRNVKLTFQTKKGLKELLKHYVNIQTKIVETGEISHTTSQVAVHPVHEKKASTYEYFPIESTFVAGKKEDKYSLFVNTEGKGYVDDEKKKYLEFLFRIPVKQQTRVFTELGGAPERYYLKYTTPSIDFIGGDYIYKMSPLTINSRYGRGGAVTLKVPKVDIGTLYVHKSDAVPNSNFATFLKFFPKQSLKFAAHYLNTSGRIISKEISTTSQANTYSLQGQYQKKDQFSINAEYATSGKTDLQKRGFGQAYYATCNYKPFNSLWMTATKYYGNPNFVGYYQDQSQFNAAIGFPIYRKLRGTLSYQTYEVNLDKNPQLNSSNKTKRALGELTCSFPHRVFAAASYNYYESEDFLFNSKYHTSYAGFRLTKVFDKHSFQGNAEFGSYHTNREGARDRTWQNYQLNVYFNATKHMKYTLYGKWGFENLAPAVQWTQTYGGSVDYFYQKKAHIQLLYEHTHRNQTFKRNFFQGRLQLILPKNHKLGAKANVWNQSNIRNVFQFVLEYTLPWNAPYKKNKKISSAKGRIFQQTEDGLKPFSNIIVACNAYKTRTDKNGRYDFAGMAPGDGTLWLEGEPENYTTTNYCPVDIALEPGKTKLQDFVMVKVAKIEGNLSSYNFADASDDVSHTTLSQKVFSKGKSKYRKAAPNSKATLRLISQESDEIHIVKPNLNGDFSFEHVRPGKWQMKVEMERIPEDYFLEESEFMINLDPNEETYLELRLLPKKRQFILIE